jgi:hypothetical protein
LNAVTRQRRANARRIAQAAAAATAATAAVALSGGAAHAAAVTALPDRPSAAVPSAGTDRLPLAAFDRADALSGRPVGIDLIAGESSAKVTVALTEPPVHGHVVLGDDATATYRSLPAFTGTDSFGYRITDERGRSSRVTVAVAVSPDRV